MTVSTAAGKVLTGSGPQGIFGSFLGKQKGTRPAGRNRTKKWERRRASLPHSALRLKQFFSMMTGKKQNLPLRRQFLKKLEGPLGPHVVKGGQGLVQHQRCIRQAKVTHR